MRAATMPEPHSDRPDQLDEQVAADVAALSELTAAGIEVDGQVQVAEATWVLYGHTSYDGEIVVGEYHSAVEASEVLRAAPRPGPHPAPDPDPDRDGPIP